MLSILETSNVSLRSVSMFISAIKVMLCPSILQTCLSNNVKVARLLYLSHLSILSFYLSINTFYLYALFQNYLFSIFSLSLKIFVSLVTKFHDHLKKEIEIFIMHLFLKIIESPNSSLEHKKLVLEVLLQITTNPDTLIQM